MPHRCSFVALLIVSLAAAPCARAAAPPVPDWIAAEDFDPGVNRTVTKMISVYQRNKPLGKRIEKIHDIWVKDRTPFDVVNDDRGLHVIDTRAHALIEEAIKYEALDIATDESRDRQLRSADIDALESFAQRLDFLPPRVQSSIRMDLHYARAALNPPAAPQ